MFKASTLRRILASEGILKTAYANTLSYMVQLGSDAANYNATVRGEDNIPNYRDTAKQVERLLENSVRNIDSITFDPRRGTMKVYLTFDSGADEEKSLYKAEADLEKAFKEIGEGYDHHRYFLYGSIDGDFSDFKIEDGAIEAWG